MWVSGCAREREYIHTSLHVCLPSYPHSYSLVSGRTRSPTQKCMSACLRSRESCIQAYMCLSAYLHARTRVSDRTHSPTHECKSACSRSRESCWHVILNAIRNPNQDQLTHRPVSLPSRRCHSVLPRAVLSFSITISISTPLPPLAASLA